MLRLHIRINSRDYLWRSTVEIIMVRSAVEINFRDCMLRDHVLRVSGKISCGDYPLGALLRLSVEISC